MSYRKIWSEAYGPIPIDENGQSYEIHHLNGNRNDNRLENLLCVSIEEHFNIHMKQGDYLAAASIQKRMNNIVYSQEVSILGGKYAYENKLGFHGLSEEKLQEIRVSGGKATLNYRWFNDGINHTRALTCPDGWFPGRLNNKGKPPIGIPHGVFWNNGIINKRSIECPGEEWVRGRIKR